MGSNLELIELNSRAREFLSLEVAAHQSGLVATVAESYADAFFHRISATESSNLGFAASIRNGVPAGFIMCSDPTETQANPWVWRLLVDQNHQGMGVGTFALEAAISRYREMGQTRLLVTWVPRPESPAGFYEKFGFVETGELIDDEVVAELAL